MPPLAAIAPIIASVAGAGISAGVSALTKPDEHALPKERREGLGSFAEKLAQDSAANDRARQDGFVFGANSRPIKFAPRKVQVDRPLNFSTTAA